MYENRYDAEVYANSELVKLATGVLEPGDDLDRFLNYAVTAYGILPESKMVEAMAAFEHFRTRKLANYDPPAHPEDFQDEYEEASFQIRRALYDVKYWKYVFENNGPVPQGTDAGTRFQIAQMEGNRATLNWMCVFGPILSTIAHMHLDETELEYDVNENIARMHGDAKPVSFQPTIPEKDMQFNEKRLASIALIDQLESGIDAYPEDVLDDLAHATVDEIPEILGNTKLGDLIKSRVTPFSQVMRLRERAKSVLRIRHNRVEPKPEPTPSTGDPEKDFIQALRTGQFRLPSEVAKEVYDRDGDEGRADAGEYDDK